MDRINKYIRTGLKKLKGKVGKIKKNNIFFYFDINLYPRVYITFLWHYLFCPIFDRRTVIFPTVDSVFKDWATCNWGTCIRDKDKVPLSPYLINLYSYILPYLSKWQTLITVSFEMKGHLNLVTKL